MLVVYQATICPGDAGHQRDALYLDWLYVSWFTAFYFFNEMH